MLDTTLFWLAVGASGFALYACGTLVMGVRRLRYLSAIDAALPARVPNVSIVAAARNEERDIEAAVRSWLALDYPLLEVIVVDDRSDDATGAILDRLTGADQRLRVVHLTRLPPGWIGKNHALFTGAQTARGAVLLFTDADVCMERSVLRRAVNVMQAERIDHLVVAPQVIPRRRLLKSLITAFSILFLLYARPWKARDPDSRAHMGVGAFNMVRRDAYQAAGTHRAIAMRPDDDLKLGKLIKGAGLRQDMLLGHGLLWLEWYPSWSAMVDGLMKNAFAALEYRLSLVVLMSLLYLGFLVWPFPALLFTHGAAFYLNALTVLLLCSLYAGTARRLDFPPWDAPLLPAMLLAFLYICWRATLLTLGQGGIYWRGTYYSLSALRANRL